MVAALAIAGTEDEVHDQARQFTELVDTIILYCPYFGLDSMRHEKTMPTC